MKRDMKGSQQQGRPSCADGARLDPQTQKHIGRMLKAVYDEVAREPVPDKFLDLLRQLEAKEPHKQ